MTTLDAVPPPKGSAFGWWPTRRGAVLDVMIALSAAVLPMLSLLFVVALSGRSLPGIASAAGFPVRPTTGLVVRLVGQALLPLTLIARRRFPAAVAAVILAEAATLSATVDLIVAMYTLAAYGTSRRVLVGLSVLAPVAVTRPWRWLAAPNESLPVPGYLVAMFTVINILVVVVVPVMIGLYVSARRRRLVALRDRADRLEREQVLLEQQARAEERTRIAREMHDVLAHQVSLMVVNAGALEMAADKQPDRVGDAASRIADIGRTALGELRQIVGVLKEDDIGDAPPLAPQPTLADLDALVEQSRSVGVPVIVRVEGVRRRLDNVVERTAYRVVQEGLTNVHKHAGGARTEVTLRFLADSLDVSVVNDAPPLTIDAGLPSGGHGLTGLRERMALLGGEFRSGPRPGGGFEMTAMIKIAESCR